jgi:hypothetical protein
MREPHASTEALYIAKLRARATIAAGLIAARTVNLETVHATNPAASGDPHVLKLKNVVDIVMAQVIEAD